MAVHLAAGSRGTLCARPGVRAALALLLAAGVRLTARKALLPRLESLPQAVSARAQVLPSPFESVLNGYDELVTRTSQERGSCSCAATPYGAAPARLCSSWSSARLSRCRGGPPIQRKRVATLVVAERVCLCALQTRQSAFVVYAVVHVICM